MAGEARTSAFMLGNATVMIGPQSALYDLNVNQHSIGLVKNFSISTEPNYVELTQGEKSNIVYSVMTANPVRAQMEVFEYTTRNLMYGLGLDGSTITPFGNEYVSTVAVTGSDSTPVTSIAFTAATNVSGDFPVGAWVSIQHPTQNDIVHYARLTAATTTTGTAPSITHTLTFAGQGFKSGNNMPLGAKVQRATRVDVGSQVDQPFLAAKVVGVLPERQEPVGLLIPKMRVTRGFTLAFTMENFGNLPFQFQPYDLLPTDPFFNDFVGRGPVALMAST